MRKLVSVLLASLISVAIAFAQDCKLCGSPPRVTLYDFDVQVPKPTDSAYYLRWQALFSIAPGVTSQIYAANKKCVVFLQALHTNATGEQVLRAGTTHPALPAQGNLSKNGDYLVSGTITGGGNNYNLNIQYQTACREVIFQANYSFQLPDDSTSPHDVGQHIAARLPNLSEKISEYAATKRDQDPKVAFSNWSQEELRIEPKKRTLGPGEETEIIITLTDCDGKRLPNREISFKKSSVNGGSIEGTTGGTVTPGIVTTDNTGKAKAKFKMGEKKNALIAAHHKFNKPNGCEQDIFFGSTPIGGVPVKVTIDYAYSEQYSFIPDFQLGPTKTVGGREVGSFSRTFRTVLYHYPIKDEEGKLVHVRPDTKSRTTFESLSGDFVYRMNTERADVEVYLGDQKFLADTLYEAKNEFNSGHADPNNAVIDFNNGEGFLPMYFQIDFNFKNELNHPIGVGGFTNSVNVSKGEKYVSFVVNKIKDSQSPYKTEYLIQLDRDPTEAPPVSEIGIDVSGFLKLRKASGHETLTVRILSPF